MNLDHLAAFERIVREGGFGRAALAQPYLAKVMKTRTYAFPGKGIGSGPKRKRYQIQNHNRLLFNYPGATGLKNGWTSAAGGSFVGTATRGGRAYVATVLRADTNTWRASAALLDWAFIAGASARPVGDLAAPAVAAPTSAPRSASAPTSPSPRPSTGPTSSSPPGATLAAAGPDGHTEPVGAGSAWPWAAGGAAVITLAATGLGLLRRRNGRRGGSGRRRS